MSGEAKPDRLLLLAHHHPGRLRVRARVLEWDEPMLAAIERWLTEQSGVQAVSAHPPAGSVLVTYDPSVTDAGQLLVGIASQAHLAIGEAAAGAAAAQAAFDSVRALDELVLQLSGGRCGLGVAIPIAFGVGSIGSFLFSAHIRAPRWDNLLSWGLQLFCSLDDGRHLGRRPEERSRDDRRHASSG